MKAAGIPALTKIFSDKNGMLTQLVIIAVQALVAWNLDHITSAVEQKDGMKIVYATEYKIAIR